MNYLLTHRPIGYLGGVNTIRNDANANKDAVYVVDVPTSPHYRKLMYFDGTTWNYDHDRLDKLDTTTIFPASFQKIILNFVDDTIFIPSQISFFANNRRAFFTIPAMQQAQALNTSEIATNIVLLYVNTSTGQIFTYSSNGANDDNSIMLGWYTKDLSCMNFGSLPVTIIKNESDLVDMDALEESLLEEAMSRVVELNKNTKCLNFAFITDTHANGFENQTVRTNYNIELFKKICNLNILDFAAHGGDIISAYGMTRAEYVQTLMKSLAEYSNIDIPMYFVKGNHEVNAEDGYVEGTAVEIPQYYLMVQNRDKQNKVVNSQMPYDGYYYVDFEDAKIRVIVANVFRRADNGVNMNMGSKEEGWMYNTALNFSEKEEPNK